MTDSRLTGCVKWFNSKTGYGFITVLGDNSSDIFVHYSNVKVDGLQYTYLVQGEYIEFELAETSGENTKHTHQAVNITGIRGGPIMCKTRYLNRQSLSQEDDDENDEVVAVKRSRPAPQSRGPPRQLKAPRAPRSSSGRPSSFEDSVGPDEFTTVVRKNRSAKKE